MDDETKSATAVPTHTDRLAAPVYTPLCPPRIDSISHEALVKWRSAREEYEAMVETWCAGTQENPDSVRVSVKNSMDLQLLTACCTYKWKIAVDKIDDERLVKELNKIVDSVKNSTVPDIDKLFDSRLKMNLRESDVGARVINYFKLCDDIIRENGLTTIMDSKQGAKEKCKILVRSIEPAALRETVQLHQRFHDSASKADAVKLFDLVMEKALRQEEMYLLSESRRPDQKKRPFGRNATAGVKKTRTGQPRIVKSNGDKVRRAEEVKWEKSPHDGSQSMSPRMCLHCGGQHLVRSCPTVSLDEKVKLLKEHSAMLRGSLPKQNMRAKKAGSAMTESGSNPVTMACLNDVELVPYCADSGSDVNLISRAHLEAVKAKDKSVIEYALDKPVVSSTVGGCIQSTHAVELFVTLHTAAGPVRCQDRKLCLVIEGEEEEFIVGKTLLRELGIDVDRLLEMLAARKVDSDDDPVSPAETPEPFQVKLDVIEIVSEMVEDAIRKGFPERNREKLRETCLMYDIWRLALGNDPPALVDPLEIRLKPGATPYKCRPRTYSPEKSKFLEDFNNQLVSIGWVYENPKSRWACPAVPVRKAKSKEYRQTSDYRPVNDKTDTIVGMMPNLHVALEHCRGKKYYSVFDFLKGFWQLPLAKASREILSYMTDKKIFTPMRVPQGSADAALHFQATVEKVLDELLYKHVLVWIDDLLLFSDSVEELLSVMERVFFLLDQRGLKLSPKKSHLFLTEVKWCGRIISEAGIGHDVERIRALQSLPYPPTAAALQQFVCATNWLRDGLVDYARVIEPLQKRLDVALKGRRRTKASAAHVAIELSVEEKQCFDDVKQLLSHSAVLTYPLPESQMCLLSDASDKGWGLVVTQVANWTPTTPIQAQQHELLICMGGTFKGSQLNWTVLEKEMFPIAHACDKLEYLLLRAQGFKIYCDHRNIVHLFVPGKELKKHVRGKLLRWSTKLLGYRYQIEHIDGIHNLWADLISRWGGAMAAHGTKGAEMGDDHCTDRSSTADAATVMNTEAGGSGDHCDQPMGAKRARAGGDHMNTLCQDQSLSAMRAAVVNTGIGCNDSHLGQRKEAMRAHAVADRRLAAMRARVEDGYEHVGERQFSCSRAKSAADMPMSGMRHFTGTSSTHYTQLVRCESPTAEVAAQAMLNWYSNFGLAKIWISDCGTHFKNKVIRELCTRLKAKQDFVLAYCPWRSGTVERVNRDIIQVLKVLILEYKINRRDWPYLLPLVQASLNHSQVASLAHKAPIELFTGLQCPSPLTTILAPSSHEMIVTIEDTSACVEAKLRSLRESLRAMHLVVKEKKRNQTQYNVEKRKGKPVNFSVGDYVLRSRVDERRGLGKLMVTWTGPFRVVEACEYYFVVEHLITKDRTDVHASRLKFYRDDSLNVTHELIEHVGAQDTLLGVERICNHKYNDNMKSYELLVKWKGFEDIEDSWEPVEAIRADVPDLVKRYVDQCGDRKLQRYQRQQLPHNPDEHPLDRTVGVDQRRERVNNWLRAASRHVCVGLHILRALILENLVSCVKNTRGEYPGVPAPPFECLTSRSVRETPHADSKAYGCVPESEHEIVGEVADSEDCGYNEEQSERQYSTADPGANISQVVHREQDGEVCELENDDEHPPFDDDICMEPPRFDCDYESESVAYSENRDDGDDHLSDRSDMDEKHEGESGMIDEMPEAS
ncbi:hypothetical protein FI667_g1302, partial [Globisporangium splendens]